MRWCRWRFLRLRLPRSPSPPTVAALTDFSRGQRRRPGERDAPFRTSRLVPRLRRFRAIITEGPPGLGAAEGFVSEKQPLPTPTCPPECAPTPPREARASRSFFCGPPPEP